MHFALIQIRRPANKPTEAVMSEAPVVALISSKSSSLLNFRRSLIEAMIAAGYRVVGFGPEREPDVIEGLAAIGAGFDDWPLARTGMNPRLDAQSLAVLTTKLRRLRPAVVVTYTIKPNIWGTYAARLAGVPRVVSLITGLGYVYVDPSPRAKLVRKPVSVLLRGAMALNDRILTYNQGIDEVFTAEGIINDRSPIERVAGSGVDMSYFRRQPLRPDPITFTMVARLLETKGVREFVEAARIVRSTHPNARFVLVGDYDPNPAGLGRAEVESWVAAGIVDYRGSVSDVRPILEEASVFVLPSWSEGISRSTLEAMATGRAVITTDAQGCRETVKHGETGYLVPVRSPTALASAMCELLNNPSRIADFGEAAYHFCAETFAVERVNAQVIAALSA